ncbi:hypothetical protein [Pseudomonas protegens]|uniref:hypothetical protein n=1 Tax=Pseudomonas protegens TaxID=380021 RepID=UPI003209ED3D
MEETSQMTVMSAAQAREKSPAPMATKLVEAPVREQMNPHERKYRPYLKLPSLG